MLGNVCYKIHMRLWLEYNALPNVLYYKVFTTLPGTPTTVAPSGDRPEDSGTSTDVAVVTNRYLPIGKIWTFLAGEYHRENCAITPYFCSTKYMTETVMNKMETWTNVIGEYRYIIFLRKLTPTKPTQCVC